MDFVDYAFCRCRDCDKNYNWKVRLNFGSLRCGEEMKSFGGAFRDFPALKFVLQEISPPSYPIWRDSVSQILWKSPTLRSDEKFLGGTFSDFSALKFFEENFFPPYDR